MLEGGGQRAAPDDTTRLCGVHVLPHAHVAKEPPWSALCAATCGMYTAQEPRGAPSDDPHSGENQGSGCDAARGSHSGLDQGWGQSPRAAMSAASGREAHGDGDLDGGPGAVHTEDVPMSVMSGDMGAASVACPGALSVCRAPADFAFSFTDSDMDLDADGDSCSSV